MRRKKACTGSWVKQVNAIANIDYRFYFALFCRRLPVFLTVFVLAGGVFVTATMLWPVSYQATARILVESPQIPTELAKSTVPTGAAEQFQIIQEDVLSRQSLLDIANRFHLFASRPNLSETDIIAEMRTRLGISPTSVGGGTGTIATVFEITFKAARPKTAADVVNDLVDMILKKDVELRTARASETVTFFNKETARLTASLAIVDKQILSFKNENIAALPDSLDFRRTQQTNQQDRLLVLAQEEAALRKRQLALQQRPADPAATPVTPEEQQLALLRQSLAQQQVVFSETSPTIVSLRSRIAALEASLGNQTTISPDGSQSVQKQTPEWYDIEDRLAEISDERSQIAITLTDLAASIQATPGVETTLNALMRDHQNLQAQYDSAVARLAEASTGQQIELMLKGERLSLIESAIPPEKSQGLGQRTLLLASALGALGLALASIIVPELFNRQVRRPTELVTRLQIAPLVTIPYIERGSPGLDWLRKLGGSVGHKLWFGAPRRAFSPPSLSPFSRQRQSH